MVAKDRPGLKLDVQAKMTPILRALAGTRTKERVLVKPIPITCRYFKRP